MKTAHSKNVGFDEFSKTEQSYVNNMMMMKQS